MNLQFAPAQASSNAGTYDALFNAMILFSTAIVILVGFLIVYFSVRYRAGSSVTRKRVPELFRRELEIGWTAATAFAALFIFWWASTVALQQRAPPQGAMEVHVEAKQWMWKTRQPNGVREINGLHIPINQPVALYLNSQDVIHSFYVPAFRLKQDVMPGRTTITWFEATKPGTYRLFCAEYCGTDHAEMGRTIVAMEPAEYARWLASRPEGDTLVAEGAALFTSAGCSGCHAGASDVHAPSLVGIFGRDIPLDDGRVVEANEVYLRDSIVLPARDVAAGYKPIMPDFGRILEDAEVEALVAYIKSLSDEGAG
jgi:cytochrome c oxidase subunit II